MRSPDRPSPWAGPPERLPHRLARRLGEAVRALRRAVLLRRRPLAALLVAVATLAALRSTSSPSPPTAALLTAAHDLPAGTVLTAVDLVSLEVPPGGVPDGSTTAAEATGRTLAAPLRRGEPVTDVRLVGAGLLRGYDSLVAVPVRIPDAAAVALLRTGDVIDLLATDPRGGGTDLVATDVPILALPALDPDDVTSASGGAAGRLVLLGAPLGLAAQLADAAVRRYLTVTISR